jgi:hypothetical protein
MPPAKGFPTPSKIRATELESRRDGIEVRRGIATQAPLSMVKHRIEECVSESIRISRITLSSIIGP